MLETTVDLILAATGTDEVLDPMRHIAWYRAALVVVWGGLVVYVSALIVRLERYESATSKRQDGA